MAASTHFFVQLNMLKSRLNKFINMHLLSNDIVYRASIIVVVILFAEQVPCLLEEESALGESIKKPGCFGLGNKFSLLNI